MDTNKNRMAIVLFNYGHFAVLPEDAGALVAIALRAGAVEQVGYRGPYFVKAEQDTFISAVYPGEVSPSRVTEETGDEAAAEVAAEPEEAPF